MATQVSDTGSKSKARGSLDELAVIAQRAQAFTNASGTAIALSEGSSDEIICRARSGASAPDVGTALRVEGSFTGLCIQSGKELRCDDAETDTRVDTAAIRALGIRSMVVTPIKDENRVVGVLAVFAPTAHAFTITHVAVLKTMADQISVLLQKERKAREEGVQPEPAAARPSAPVAMPKPVAAAAPAPAPAPTLPPPVVIKPAAPAARTASFPVVSRVEPIKTAPVADDVAISVPLPRKEERRSEAKAEHRAGLGTLDSVAEEGKKSQNRLIIIGLLAVVAIGAGATVAYKKLRKPAPPAAAVTAPQPPANAVPGIAPGSPTATNGQPAAPGSAPSTGGSTPAAASSAPKPAPQPAAADTSRKEDRSAGKQPKPSASTPAPVSTPAAVAISTGESKIDQPAAGGGQTGADVAPVLTLGQGNATGEISALVAKPVAASTPSMISQSDLEQAQVLKKVPPVYPAIARVRRLTGTVTVEFTVGKDGKVRDLKLTSGPPIFREAAFDAVKQWVFKPAKLNGQNIEQTEQVTMSFNP